MKPLRVVHLPCYEDNAYQGLLMNSLRELGVETIHGGAGGRFFRTALRQWKPDILHFHWMHPYMQGSTALATLSKTQMLLLELGVIRRTGTRLVWTVHNLVDHESPHPRVERWCYRRFARKVDALIAHGPAAAQTITRAYALDDGTRMHVIPHGHYIGVYPRTISRDEARRALNLPGSAVVFLFLGQIRPYKGVTELIEAFDELGDVDAHLLIAGRCHDRMRDQIQRHIAAGRERLTIHDRYVPDDELQQYIQACDVMVFPFRQVLTSGSLVLAMSCGRACVVPSSACIGDTIDEQGAIVYAPDEPGALARALRQACDRRGELARMGCYNAARIKRHDWSAVAGQTLAVYRKCIDSAQTPTPA